MVAVFKGLLSFSILFSPTAYALIDKAPATSCAQSLQNKKSNPISPVLYHEELKRTLKQIYEVYANVHGAASERSQASTELHRVAREIALKYVGKKNDGEYTVIMNNTRNIRMLTESLEEMGATYQVLSATSLGQFSINADVNFLVAKKADLPASPLAPGSGTATTVTNKEILWADVPGRFEPGTPNISMNILFAKALKLAMEHRSNGTSLAENYYPPIGVDEIENILFQDELLNLEGNNLLEAIQSRFITGDPNEVYVDHGASNITFDLIKHVISQLLFREITDEARDYLNSRSEQKLLELLDASQRDYEVIFTGNASDASSILMQSVSIDIRKLQDQGRSIAVLGSQVEHDSSRLPYAGKFTGGIKRIEYINLDINKKGFFDVNELEALLKMHNSEGSSHPFISFIQLSGASNVYGSFNDIQKAVQIAHKYKAKIAIDGAPLLAHKKISLKELKADFIFISAHKIYAPAGSGALIAKKSALSFDEATFNQLKKDGQRNLVGIAALTKAIDVYLRIGIDNIVEHEQLITRDLIDKLGKLPGLQVYGETEDLSVRAGVITMTHDKFPADTVAQWLQEDANIGSRSGNFSAAAAVHIGVGYTASDIDELIAAVGLENLYKVSPIMLRIGLGINNTTTDNDRIIASLEKLFASKTPNKLEFHLASRFAKAPPSPLTSEMIKSYANIFNVSKKKIKSWDRDLRSFNAKGSGRQKTLQFVDRAVTRIFGDLEVKGEELQ